MEQVRLDVQLRKNKGKGYAREIRRIGMVPGVVYGHKQEPIKIQLMESRIHRIIRHGGENVLININIADHGEEVTMIKELQTDPLTKKIIHADFMRVSLEERITTHIPVTLVGEPIGVNEGGVLEFLLRELSIECQVGNIPEDIKIDISSLKIGDQIRVEDITLPNDMICHDEPVTVIVTVASPTVIKEGEELISDEEREPEVISERRRAEKEEE
ncbi:TPA: 50S ribosomal protein L25 [bacterium]|nr:50S ribosomal protein L25 [bacterium]